MSKKNALAFAIGLGGGYMKADRQAKEDALAEEDRQAKAEERARAREEHGWKRNAQERETRKQLDLADAAAPRSAVEGSVVTDASGNKNLYADPGQAAAAQADLQAEAEMRGAPSLADVKPGYGVTGTSLGNVITDQKPDVASLNTPQARNQRVIEATRKYDPKEAITLDAATTAAEKARFELNESKRKLAASAKREGLEDTYKAMRSGDPQAVFDAFNAQGDYKMVEPPKVVEKRKVKAPWGEVEDDVWEAQVVNPDGSIRPVRMSTMQLGLKLQSVDDLSKQDAKAGEMTLGHKFRLETIDRQYRRTAEHKKATGGDNLSREERLRYTSLFQDAGRRMGEAQRALSTLQKDPLYSLAKPGSPQYGELQALRESIQTFASERSTYQSMLAGSQTQDGPGQVGAPSRSTPSKSPSAWNSPERESDRLTILNSELEKARRAGNTGDVAALEREIANVSGNKPSGQAATNGAPQRVSTRAERDKLPKGTRYIGPDGKTYIKQ